MSRGAPEDVGPQHFARNASKALELRDVIDRDLNPLRCSSSAQTQGLRHGNDAAKLLRGLENDRVAFAHDRTYSMAKHSRSSPAIPATPPDERQWDMSLGSRMRAARDRAKKTQQQVADELSVTKGAISQWENDQTVPELEYFVAFCVFTDASADEVLLHREMDPLLSQLVDIWKQLSQDGKDSLLGNANRILSREHPEAGPHNPFPRNPRPSLNTPKTARKSRQQ